MKKTIAILLVLIIGMVGAFAANPADAVLNLSTTIDLVNRLAITDSTTDTYTFGEGADTVSVDFDPKDAFGTDVTAGYVHYKTNNAGNVDITLKATALVNGTDSSLMPYTLGCGGATVTASTAAAITGTGKVFTTLNAASMLEDTEAITINIDGTADDYAAGTYTATVTFMFEAT